MTTRSMLWSVQGTDLFQKEFKVNTNRSDVRAACPESPYVYYGTRRALLKHGLPEKHLSWLVLPASAYRLSDMSLANSVAARAQRDIV